MSFPNAGPAVWPLLLVEDIAMPEIGEAAGPGVGEELEVENEGEEMPEMRQKRGRRLEPTL